MGLLTGAIDAYKQARDMEKKAKAMEKQQLEFATGHIELKPTVFRIVGKVVPRWWFLNKTEYWIETDYIRTGPFATIEDAKEMLTLGGVKDYELG